jgi:GT2 family glycosyltransferase
VRLVDHRENLGFVKSLIEGATLSRAPYISVISADDWVANPKAFELQVQSLEQDPEIAFAFGAYRHHDDSGLVDHVWRPWNTNFVRDGYELFRELVVAPYVLHSGTIIRKSIYEAVGGYDASLRYAVDTKMWLALCLAGKGAFIQDELYAYRRHGASMSKSATSIELTIREVLKVIQWSFDSMPRERQREFVGLRSKAERRALIAFAADEVFGNNYREGWRGFRVAAGVKPVETVFQRATGILLLRALLGEKWFKVARKSNAKLASLVGDLADATK